MAKKTTTKTVVHKPTTKVVVKKATVVKQKAEKLTSSKTAVFEISLSGNKKLGTLMKEFNKKFPYLYLSVFKSCSATYYGDEEEIGSFHLSSIHIDLDKTLAEMRLSDRTIPSGVISIAGNKKIKSIKEEFEKVMSGKWYVCYTKGRHTTYFATGFIEEKTLASFNAECEKNGCIKGVWKDERFC